MATAKPAPAAESDTVQKLEDELRDLEERLRNGEEMVRDAREHGGDRLRLEQWEKWWETLLRRYEILYDRLQRQTAARRVVDPAGDAASFVPTG